MCDDTHYVPASDVLEGVRVHNVPEGTILEAMVAVKYLDEDGEICWAFTKSRDLNDMEALGITGYMRKTIEASMFGYLRED